MSRLTLTICISLSFSDTRLYREVIGKKGQRSGYVWLNVPYFKMASLLMWFLFLHNLDLVALSLDTNISNKLLT